MTEGSRWVTSKGTLAVGSLATTAAAVIYREYVHGVIQTIGTFGSGFEFALGGLGSFLASDEGLISGLLGIAIDGTAASMATHSRWLANTFGLLALPVGILEFALLVWLVGEAAGGFVRFVRGGLG